MESTRISKKPTRISANNSTTDNKLKKKSENLEKQCETHLICYIVLIARQRHLVAERDLLLRRIQ